MSNKYIIAAVAIIAAFMMLAIPFAATESDATTTSVSSSTSTGLGEFNIYFQVDSSVTLPTAVSNNSSLSGVGSGWVGYMGSGSNGYLATLDVLTDMGMADTTYVFDDAYTVTTPYYTNNISYGTITELLDLSTSGSNSWHVYVYQDDVWVSGVDAIGLYQPYSDYTVSSSVYKTANIAFYYGEEDAELDFDNLTTMAYTSVPTTAQDANASSYAVSFTFVYPVDEVTTVMTAVGYGSNAFTALQNAIGTNAETGVVGSNTFSSYAWLTSIFGLGTVQTAGGDTPNDWTDDTYTYWNLYYYDAATPGFAYSNLTSGFYCPLDGSAFQCDNFLFVYA